MRLPDAWIERLFERFTMLYGAPKVGSMWADTDLEKVKAVWAEALGQFSGETLRKALEALEQTSTEWPPTLPSFVGLCKQYNRPEHRPALVVPGGNVTDDETARKNLALIREMLAGALKGKVTSS